MDHKYDFIKKLLLGLALGIASITPGISAGVIAAAAGIYEPAVRALVNFRKEYRQSFRFLFPLGLGVAAGILLFSRVWQQLMFTAEFRVLYVFLGLVAGSIPALFKEANCHGFRRIDSGRPGHYFVYRKADGLVSPILRSGGAGCRHCSPLRCGAGIWFNYSGDQLFFNPDVSWDL